MGLRTEHIAIARLGPTKRGSDGEGVAATVTRIEHLGDQSHIHLDMTGQSIVALADPDSGLGVGDKVGVALRDALLFDAKGERVRA